MLRHCAQSAARRGALRRLNVLHHLPCQDLTPSVGLATTSGRTFLDPSADALSSVKSADVRTLHQHAAAKLFSTSTSCRQTSSPKNEETEEGPAGSAAAGAPGTSGAGNGEEPSEGTLDTAQLQAEVDATTEQVEDLKDKLARSLADMENLRERTARATEQSRTFAIQKFVSGLLSVADDMERALESVPADAQQHKDPAKLLQGLRDGVTLTNKTLEKVLSANGVSKLTAEVGQMLDPNQHEAMFDVPDPNSKPGTIAIIVKPGYTLNGRVIRPVEVGTVRSMKG